MWGFGLLELESEFPRHAVSSTKASLERTFHGKWWLCSFDVCHEGRWSTITLSLPNHAYCLPAAENVEGSLLTSVPHSILEGLLFTKSANSPRSLFPQCRASDSWYLIEGNYKSQLLISKWDKLWYNPCQSSPWYQAGARIQRRDHIFV